MQPHIIPILTVINPSLILIKYIYLYYLTHHHSWVLKAWNSQSKSQCGWRGLKGDIRSGLLAVGLSKCCTCLAVLAELWVAAFCTNIISEVWPRACYRKVFATDVSPVQLFCFLSVNSGCLTSDIISSGFKCSSLLTNANILSISF